MSATKDTSNGPEKYHVYDNPRPVKRLKVDAKGPRRWLIFGGGTGWVGKMIVDLLSSGEEQVFAATSRLENRKDIIAEFESLHPTHVVNAAGLTGRPNVDWCELHKQDTVRVNVMGTLNLVDICFQHGVHLTNCATGCIYHYHVKPEGEEARGNESVVYEGSNRGFKETDAPNFIGSYYSKTKAIVEDLLVSAGYLENVLNLRFRMPISEDLHHRSLLTKLIKYEKVVNIKNSITVLPNMLPVMIELAKHGKVGIFNFTSPGAVSHNELLSMFKESIDADFTWTNFTLEEQNKVILAKRSNNELDSTKLIAACKEVGAELLPVHEALKELFQTMKKNGVVPLKREK